MGAMIVTTTVLLRPHSPPPMNQLFLLIVATTQPSVKQAKMATILTPITAESIGTATAMLETTTSAPTTSCLTWFGQVATFPTLWTAVTDQFVETVMRTVARVTAVEVVVSLLTATTQEMTTSLIARLNHWAGMQIHSTAGNTTTASRTTGQ